MPKEWTCECEPAIGIWAPIYYYVIIIIIIINVFMWILMNR